MRAADVLLPWRGETLSILQPGDIDLLLDAVAHDPEQNLPHWAELWPSGIALADAVLAEPGLVRGRRVLELGCGLGVTAVAALRSGAHLTVADYSTETLSLCQYNTLTNAGLEPDEALQVNWRALSDAFMARVGPGFDVVLAADVLYETRDIYPLIEAVEQLVARNGLLWLAEPGRGVARRFLEIARERAWCGAGEPTLHHGPWPDPRDEGATVALYQLRR